MAAIVCCGVMGIMGVGIKEGGDRRKGGRRKGKRKGEREQQGRGAVLYQLAAALGLFKPEMGVQTPRAR